MNAFRTLPENREKYTPPPSPHSREVKEQVAQQALQEVSSTEKKDELIKTYETLLEERIRNYLSIIEEERKEGYLSDNEYHHLLSTFLKRERQRKGDSISGIEDQDGKQVSLKTQSPHYANSTR